MPTRGLPHYWTADQVKIILVLQRRVVVALRERFVMRVCCDSWREQIYEGNGLGIGGRASNASL